jgi:hypothetical protein
MNDTIPTIEEIQNLVTFTRTDREWRVNQVFGNVWGDVGGDVLGNVGGSVWRNVKGNVRGTIGGREWAPVLTLKERICQAVERGYTELALELLQGADISEAP